MIGGSLFIPGKRVLLSTRLIPPVTEGEKMVDFYSFLGRKSGKKGDSKVTSLKRNPGTICSNVSN